NSFSSRRSVRNPPVFCAAPVFSTDALADPGAVAAYEHCLALGLFVDGSSTPHQCHNAIRHVLPSANGSGSRGRPMGVCAAPIFSARRAGVGYVSKLQGASSSADDLATAVRPCL